MKTKYPLIGLVFAAGVLHTPTTVFGTDTSVDDLSTEVNKLFARWDKPETPGAAVVITRGGETLYKRCFGLANLEHRVPITSTTVFELASASKPFTAMAILLLEQDGKLTLDDDIRKYIPELPDFEHTITLRHLLHHTGGLWDVWTMLIYYAGFTHYDYLCLNDKLRLLERQPEPLFQPGSQWKYSSVGYDLLAEVVARVTGESFSSWTKKHIFEPLKMKDTFFKDNCLRMIPNQASSYRKKEGAYFRGRQYSVNYAGGGGAFTTIDDMALWMDNFRAYTLGGKELVDRMCKKGMLNDGREHDYGLGLNLLTRHDENVIAHSGQCDCFLTMMIYCPRKELGITILANDRAIQAEKLGFQILGLCLGKLRTARPLGERSVSHALVKADASKMKRYAGGYLVEATGAHVGVLAQPGRLICMVDGLGMEWFSPSSHGHFSNSAGDIHITFTPNDRGGIERARIDLKGDLIEVKRIVFTQSTPEQLRATYAGPYFCDALGTVYELIETNGRLVIRHRRYGDRDLVQTDEGEFMGEMGFFRFEKDANGALRGFSMFDETFNFKPIYFQKIGDVHAASP
ncbi:MAG: beta-lactamase family protein [Phycisphaerales bacterium]|nr:MAG: beta-lactamase family protein [Phycisphaerales bacterium]